MRSKTGILIAAGLVISAVVARATTVYTSPLQDVYSTGQGPVGTVDPNYVLVGAPDIYPKGSLYPDYPDVFITSIAGLPWTTAYSVLFGYMGWVSPQPSYSSDQTDTAGLWQYQTRFNIQSPVDPSTALLYGSVSSDNCMTGMLINGVAVDGWSMQGGTCLNQLHYFQIGGPQAVWTSDVSGGLKLTTPGFTQGWNTITFQVMNSAGSSWNPTGLAVWLNGEGQAVPEASTAGLVAAGLAAVVLLRRKLAR